ncbi:rubredoxin-like domain-containing protein [Methanomicrobium mobile]|nr:hypothetical protein [Methanomicrobium mobile]
MKKYVGSRSTAANCGDIGIGREAPDTCPVCDHPQAFIKKRNI